MFSDPRLCVIALPPEIQQLARRVAAHGGRMPEAVLRDGLTLEARCRHPPRSGNHAAHRRAAGLRSAPVPGDPRRGRRPPGCQYRIVSLCALVRLPPMVSEGSQAEASQAMSVRVPLLRLWHRQLGRGDRVSPLSQHRLGETCEAKRMVSRECQWGLFGQASHLPPTA